MKKLFLICFVLSSLSTLTFAASFKSSDCQKVNWEEMGKVDGQKGMKIDILYSYIKICDKANAPFSADLYRKGREEGLYTYCSNQNAYEMGFQKTRVHKDVCPFNMFPDFQVYYNKGFKYKDLEKQKIALDKKIEKLSKTIVILEATKLEKEKIISQMDEVEFKPEMLKTQIIKSTLMENMSEPLYADPGIETSVNTEKPLDLEVLPGDMSSERAPASKN